MNKKIMPAPKGNQFWKNVDPKNIGRPPKYKTPNELWEHVVKYFEQCDESPITKSETTTSDKGTYNKVYEYTIPYTWEGLYVFLEVCDLEHYKKKEEFSNILSYMDSIIKNQKYSGAAVGIFNANIIARDLGLRDESKVETTGSQVVTYKLPDNGRDKNPGNGRD